MKILAGIYPKETYSGTINLDGGPLTFSGNSIKQASEKGIAIVHQELPLVPQVSVGENIYLAREPSSFGRINWNKPYTDTKNLLAEYKLDIPFGSLVEDLSVAKQQMFEIARSLSENGHLLILDEPTRGIDVGAKYEIYKLMRKLTGEGIGIIMISSELPEILGMSDRIMVMHEGKQSGTLSRAEATQERIMALATGLA